MWDYMLIANFNCCWQEKKGISSRLERLFDEYMPAWVYQRLRENLRLAQALGELSYYSM